MKKVIILTFVLAIFLGGNVFAIDAAGSAFGCLSTAKALGQGKGYLGGGIGLGSNATSFFGTFDYGLSTYTNGRLKLGLYDPDGGDAGLVLGGDFRYQMLSIAEDPDKPFDLAPGGFFEYIDFEGGSIFELGAMAIGSYPLELSSGNILSLYGRFNLRLEHYSADGGGSDSELKFGLNGGVCFEVSELVKLYGEIQLDGNDGLFLGIDYNVL